MTRAMLFYGHVASNWGDLAINAGAVELLRRSGVDPAISTAVLISPADMFLRRATSTLKGLDTLTVPVDGTPRGGREEIELLTQYLAEPERFAAEVGMADHDVVILNAGEHLFESAVGENIADLVWRILPALAAQATGVPTIQLPATIGPFRTRLGEQIEQLLLRGLSAVAYREPESRRISVGSQTVPVLLDPGFSVPGLKMPEAPAASERLLGIVLRPEDIGIRPGSRRSSFVQKKLRDAAFQDSQAFKLFAAMAAAHMDRGGRVRVIIQTRADREISLALVDQLRNLYPTDSDAVELVDPSGFREFIESLGSLNALVTSRFHAVILALSQGVPSAGVYSETHGHKMPGLFEMLRYPNCAVRLDERNIQSVRTELDNALAQMIEAAPEISNRIKANRGLTRRWLSEALENTTVPEFDTSQLRIEALAALYRAGLRKFEHEAVSEMRRILRKLDRPDEELGADES
ncbi:polysaccharide pyruvyl transferase family protein [Brevibacterium zhoupengii]|uniref:polysaccharide pyruvyl transferase family protein n=1 Tax=Brevibacterium zhoupengii TaxID=2898795 RepID=UPI001F0A00DC|nr:polysaccharide pyruvyl transferase family protein [Brevibacterium zhoupengii]